LGLVVSLVWLWGARKIQGLAAERLETAQEAEHTPQASTISIKRLIIPSGLLFICLAIILQGTLRDGVTTWMPSYLLETFHLGSSVSILSTVILPIFSIFFIKLAAYIQRRFFTNELVCAAVIFIVGCIASAALAICYAYGVAISMILAAIITGCMHGVNLILICMVPGRFERTGRVAYISGLLNFFTYVGSALSTYGIAKLSESFGWQFTIWGWAAIALMGAMTCCLCIPKWKSFCK
jgi:OPA family glycerol-3-phosphate transporter-like MFS transporter